MGNIFLKKKRFKLSKVNMMDESQREREESIAAAAAAAAAGEKYNVASYLGR